VGVSIRYKVILPYFLLTLAVAITGAYVVTRLLTTSLEERLHNQLIQAARVVSDEMARLEKKQIEVARTAAYTEGMPQAVMAGDTKKAAQLAMSVAASQGAENLIVINAVGDELAHIVRQSDGSYRQVDKPSGVVNFSIVKDLFIKNNPDSLPRRAFGQNTVDERTYYYTALPMGFGNKQIGVVVVGTALDTLMPLFKKVSLADIILYGNDGQAVATTFDLASGEASIATFNIPANDLESIVNSADTVEGTNFTFNGREYAIMRALLRVSNDKLAAFAVVLNTEFVRTTNQKQILNSLLLFGGALLGVIALGYMVAWFIINPLLKLARTSTAIADGDLKQRTGITSSDEIGTLATSFDTMTTKLEERTDQLQNTNEMLEQMDRTKSQFIKIIAHELRTPLTLITGYTQLLQMKLKDDPEMNSYAGGIAEGTGRMTEIVNDMLELTRIESGILEISLSTVQFPILINKIYKTFRKAFEEERKISFTTDGLDGLPSIKADPKMLERVFYHLIMNAIKYTPDNGHVRISGCLIQENPAAPEVEIVVSDTGIGIDVQYHKLVFEKFFQTGEVEYHSSGRTKFKGGGPGLGLAIVKGYVEAHGGRVWAESPGHDEINYPGSSFYVRLPVNGSKA